MYTYAHNVMLHTICAYVYDDVTYVYDDVTYVYDDVTYAHNVMLHTICAYVYIIIRIYVYIYRRDNQGGVHMWAYNVYLCNMCTYIDETIKAAYICERIYVYCCTYIGETIKAAGFAELDLQYLELEDFGFLNPTVAGIATV